MTLPGAMDTVAFRVFVRQVLCPALRSGQVVLMDNLSAHKDPLVRQAIEARQCQVWLLPPYSPDFAPIELAIAKIKEGLRAAAARTQDALDQAITEALATVTPDEARNWFRHCGYPLPAP